jgi:tetratricopeptide (TPR) repeat protein
MKRKHSISRFLPLGLVFAALLSGWSPAAAEPHRKVSKEALTHYERGRARALEGDYEAAVREFQQGFEAQPEPLFLYNIAQCARVSGRGDMALDYYGRYLAAAPNAPERGDIKHWMALLERKRADGAAERRDEPGPASAASEPATSTPERAEPPAPSAAPAAPAPKDALPAAVSLAPSPPKDSPSLALSVERRPAPASQRLRKTWIAVGVVGGAVAIGLAVGLGVGLTTGHGVPSGYNDLGSLNAGRN